MSVHTNKDPRLPRLQGSHVRRNQVIDPPGVVTALLPGGRLPFAIVLGSIFARSVRRSGRRRRRLPIRVGICVVGRLLHSGVAVRLHADPQCVIKNELRERRLCESECAKLGPLGQSQVQT